MLVDNCQRFIYARRQLGRNKYMPTRVLLVILALFVTNVEGRQATSKNNVTDFFNKEIENKQGLDSSLDSAKSSAQNGIKGNQGAAELGVSNAEMEQKTSELNSIDANDLETAGMKERAKPENEYYNSLEVNYDDPQVINHHRDIDKIVEGTEKMAAKLLEGLKDYNVDCKTVKGDKEIEPQYFIDIQKKSQEDTVYNSFADVQQRQQKDTIYNKNICEQLRNKYSCTDTLTVRCNNVIAKPASISITGTNLPVLANRVGYAQLGSRNKHWLYGGKGTTFDYYVNFNVINPQGIQFFRIGSLRYDDFVLIKLNDHYIWSGPFGGTILELLPSSIGHRLFGWRQVIIDYSGKQYSPENSTWFYVALNIDMKPHLQAGNNVLSIRVIVGNKGGLLFDLSMADRECTSWSETWNETGRLD